MKNKLKIWSAVLLVGIVLCGNMVSVQAAQAEESTHTHQSYPVYAGTIRSVTTTHQYVTGVNHDMNGNIVGYEYGTCTVTTYLDQYNYVCRDCAAVTGGYTQTRVVHSVAH